MRFGPFAFSLERGELRSGDELIRITERERELLRLLCANAGRKRDARGAVGAGRGRTGTHDRRADQPARRKIERDPANPVYLQTARGAGYRLIADG